jgi:L-histidine N-alpha-methyltransferase
VTWIRKHLHRSNSITSEDHLQPETHRDQLITMLAEAAEIEDCLVCTYLYAAFSITASFDAPGNLGFFPGSTLGNFTPKAAIELLGHLGHVLGSHSRLLLGIDTTQAPALLIPAYDDASGVTAEFNLNLLDRINRELGGDFDRREFRHLVRYDPVFSRIEMHLASQRAQVVRVSGCEYEFAAGETIHTENCYKYSPSDFVRMAHAAGWRSVRLWHDDGKTRFAVYLLAREVE